MTSRHFRRYFGTLFKYINIFSISYLEMYNRFEFYEPMSTRNLATPIKEDEFSLGFCYGDC